MVSWQFAALYAFVGAAIVVRYSAHTESKSAIDTKPSEGYLYDISLGTVYCGNYAETSCGIKLWNCGGEDVYYCQLNVRKRSN